MNTYLFYVAFFALLASIHDSNGLMVFRNQTLLGQYRSPCFSAGPQTFPARVAPVTLANLFLKDSTDLCNRDVWENLNSLNLVKDHVVVATPSESQLCYKEDELQHCRDLGCVAVVDVTPELFQVGMLGNNFFSFYREHDFVDSVLVEVSQTDRKKMEKMLIAQGYLTNPDIFQIAISGESSDCENEWTITQNGNDAYVAISAIVGIISVCTAMYPLFLLFRFWHAYGSFRGKETIVWVLLCNFLGLLFRGISVAFLMCSFCGTVDFPGRVILNYGHVPLVVASNTAVALFWFKALEDSRSYVMNPTARELWRKLLIGSAIFVLLIVLLSMPLIIAFVAEFEAIARLLGALALMLNLCLFMYIGARLMHVLYVRRNIKAPQSKRAISHRNTVNRIAVSIFFSVTGLSVAGLAAIILDPHLAGNNVDGNFWAIQFVTIGFYINSIGQLLVFQPGAAMEQKTTQDGSITNGTGVATRLSDVGQSSAEPDEVSTAVGSANILINDEA